MKINLQQQQCNSFMGSLQISAFVLQYSHYFDKTPSPVSVFHSSMGCDVHTGGCKLVEPELPSKRDMIWFNETSPSD